MKFYITHLQRDIISTIRNRLIKDATVRDERNCKKKGYIMTRALEDNNVSMIISLHFTEDKPDFIEVHNINLGIFSNTKNETFLNEYVIDEKKYNIHDFNRYKKFNKYITINLQEQGNDWIIKLRILRNRNDKRHTKVIKLSY